MTTRATLLLLVAVLLTGCGGDQAPAPTPAATEDPHEGHSHDTGMHGGPMVVLGDHLAHVETLHRTAETAVDIWITDGGMNPLEPTRPPVLNLVTDDGSIRVVAKPHEDGWRFVHDVFAGHPRNARLNVSIDGKTYTPDLPHGHLEGELDHAHADHGPHDGCLAAFEAPSGKTAGFLELKLHDDKGDIELWLCADEASTTPWDLPIGTTLEVRFKDAARETVTLRARNLDRNEDEDGQPNNRDGMTNYFIFPGDTGADASWLMGSEFSAVVTVVFTKEGAEYQAGPFALRPHTHHD